MSFGFRIDPQALWARQNITLSLMLLALHAALMFGIDTALSKAFLLSHFGCSCCGSRCCAASRSCTSGRPLLIVAGGACWCGGKLVVHGVVDLRVVRADRRRGAGHPQRRRSAVVALLAATYLLAILLIWVVPHLFESGEFSRAVPRRRCATRRSPHC